MFTIYDRMGDAVGLFYSEGAASQALALSFPGCGLDPELPKDVCRDILEKAHSFRQQYLKEKRYEDVTVETVEPWDHYHRAVLVIEDTVTIKIGLGRSYGIKSGYEETFREMEESRKTINVIDSGSDNLHLVWQPEGEGAVSECFVLKGPQDAPVEKPGWNPGQDGFVEEPSASCKES